jgi:HEPN domain-containing protein
MHMLLGFSVELYLKALLFHKGKNDSDLQKIRHNLKRLYKEALVADLQRENLVQDLGSGPIKVLAD